MVIRDVVEGDLADVFAIYNREIRESSAVFSTVEVTPAEQREWLAERANPATPCLVAEIDGRVVGFAHLSLWSKKCGYSRAVEISIYVHQDARGKGIGKSLMAAIIERARSTGSKVIVARIETSGRASIALHEWAGFEPIGVMREIGEKFGRLLDVAVYDLHL
jgi:phosphinothricin acetyltransferase